MRSPHFGCAAVLLAAASVWACGGDADGSSFPSGSGANGSGANGSGSGAGSGVGGGLSMSGSGGNGQGGGGLEDCGSNLTGYLRDFQESHPDFEYVIQVDQGIVEVDLGSDGKPVYASSSTTATTTGKDNFDQWYRDVSGVNQTSTFTLNLTDNGDGTYTFQDNSFFPLDGQGWGNEGHPHNYHFTYELHTKFVYNGGEVFSFTGDDDLFVFINRKLAMDLGGVHGALNANVDLDAEASNLGISPGNVYPLDFFFAERHTSESNFRIDTTIADFVDCGPEIN